MASIKTKFLLESHQLMTPYLGSNMIKISFMSGRKKNRKSCKLLICTIVLCEFGGIYMIHKIKSFKQKMLFQQAWHSDISLPLTNCLHSLILSDSVGLIDLCEKLYMLHIICVNTNDIYLHVTGYSAGPFPAPW